MSIEVSSASTVASAETRRVIIRARGRDCRPGEGCRRSKNLCQETKCILSMIKNEKIPERSFSPVRYKRSFLVTPSAARISCRSEVPWIIPPEKIPLVRVDHQPYTGTRDALRTASPRKEQDASRSSHSEPKAWPIHFRAAHIRRIVTKGIFDISCTVEARRPPRVWTQVWTFASGSMRRHRFHLRERTETTHLFLPLADRPPNA